jgi:hypothetical protein
MLKYVQTVSRDLQSTVSAQTDIICGPSVLSILEWVGKSVLMLRYVQTVSRDLQSTVSAQTDFTCGSSILNKNILLGGRVLKNYVARELIHFMALQSAMVIGKI